VVSLSFVTVLLPDFFSVKCNIEIYGRFNMGRGRGRNSWSSNEMIEPTRSYWFEATLGFLSLVLFFLMTMP